MLTRKRRSHGAPEGHHDAMLCHTRCHRGDACRSCDCSLPYVVADARVGRHGNCGVASVGWSGPFKFGGKVQERCMLRTIVQRPCLAASPQQLRCHGHNDECFVRCKLRNCGCRHAKLHQARNPRLVRTCLESLGHLRRWQRGHAAGSATRSCRQRFLRQFLLFLSTSLSLQNYSILHLIDYFQLVLIFSSS